MKVIYSQPGCAPCKALKEKCIKEGTPFKEVVIGKDITKEQFFDKFPNVRSVPHVVEE